MNKIFDLKLIYSESEQTLSLIASKSLSVEELPEEFQNLEKGVQTTITLKIKLYDIP